jgi:UPF0042 nucleotide-binding protein
MNKLQLVLVTGMSGSGKSLAIAALEDAGYFCVDNLPPELLEAFVALQLEADSRKVAVAMDVRSATALPRLPEKLHRLAESGMQMTTVFLDATDDVLVRRFSETRRSHPLSKSGIDGHALALVDAIRQERELLSELREVALVIDTSLLKPARLLSHIKELIQVDRQPLTLVFESFAFKRGIPMDADFVFDVRMLPNPHYDPALKNLTGQDVPVAAFLAQEPAVADMQRHISEFLERWLPELMADHRSYVTVAIGCTGGQHRSVYLVETLARIFAKPWHAKTRHRELQL